MESNLDEQAVRDRVAKIAYELYEKRGRSEGCDVEDWLEAERLILDQLGNQRSTSKETPTKANRSGKGKPTEAQ